MTLRDVPSLTVVIPCRDGAGTLAACLDSVIANDWPHDRLEVLVVDGHSTDGSRAIAARYADRYPIVRLVDNPGLDRAHALNVGIRLSRGELIASMDTHCRCPPDYFRKCYETMVETGADNVGGVLRTLGRGSSLVARSIAAALSHPFGVGDSYFRIGVTGRRVVDTVPYGFFRRDVFERVGLFDERLARSQDIELNDRLRRAGGRIVLDPSIRVDYFPVSDLGSFARRNFIDGSWATYPLRTVRSGVSWRHLVPLGFVVVMGGVVALGIAWPATAFLAVAAVGTYLVVDLAVSVAAAFQRRDAALVFVLPLVFATRHVMYGLGSVFGLVRTPPRR